MFTICSNRGFRIKFENGATLSVQFGPGNYCNHQRNADYKAPSGSFQWECENAEVAILLPDDKFYRISEHDDVIGWQTAEDVAKWIEVARNL
jgi:hypothetical protein